MCKTRNNQMSWVGNKILKIILKLTGKKSFLITNRMCFHCTDKVGYEGKKACIFSVLKDLKIFLLIYKVISPYVLSATASTFGNDFRVLVGTLTIKSRQRNV